MRVVNDIVAFIFLAGIAGVGCDNKISGPERSSLSESVEKKRDRLEKQVAKIGELIAAKEYQAADNVLKDLDRQFPDALVSANSELVYVWICGASNRDLAEYRMTLNQKLGRVDSIINKDTFAIDGVVTGKTQQEGSGGFWRFVVTTPGKDHYSFMCSATAVPYFRIHGADIDVVNGYEKLQDVYNRVTLVIPNHQYRHVDQVCKNKDCNGICPTAIIMNP
jgi:hypothetical protein